MPAADARFATPNASRYLQQLCKHFAHKVEVKVSETEGRCELQTGPLWLSADESGLDIRVEAADEASLERAEFIVEDHLRRFAFREAPDAMSWREEAAQ